MFPATFAERTHGCYDDYGYYYEGVLLSENSLLKRYSHVQPLFFRCCSRSSMSGLISSLLIEPVIRRTGRLSNQTNAQPPDSDSSRSPQDQATTHRPSDNNGSTEITKADQMQEHMELGRGYARPANDPAMLDSGASRYGHGANAVSPARPENSTEYSQVNDIPVSTTSSGSVGPTPEVDAPTQGVSRRTTPLDIQDRRNSPGRALDLDDMGRQSPLPEDDGMGVMRKKIHAIRDMETSNTVKARMIHELMTENYNALRERSANQITSIALSPTSSQSPERSSTPIVRHGGGQLFDQLSATSASTASPIRPPNPYNLTDEDLKPTFFPKDEPDSPLYDEEEDIDTEEFEGAILGCQHYKRNVKLQCVACKKWYTCRFCHDAVEDHHLIRHKTENMLCMICGHAQPAAAFCEKCDEQAAQYFCEVCKLWDNDSKKSIYHCTDCGICRIGQGLGKDFFHCKTCSVCLPISIETTHRCIERSTQCDCPICGDYMFTSPETVVVMRCGHSIHHKCLSEYSKSSYRCPICSKTITSMESTFRNLDRSIQNQPMPAEFKDTNALVYCNDCSAKSVVGYHWLGLKCDMCESYNTAQIRLLHGDILESPEQDVDSRHVWSSRMRSSSHGADEAMSQAVAPLRINTSTVQGTTYPQQSAPSSADPNGRLLSYSLTRGRAVSPVVSNYFGLPSNREPETSNFTSFFGGRADRDTEGDHGELHFWGTKFKYNYGFLSRETESADGTSESDDQEDDASDGSVIEDEDEEEEEEEDDDDDESIDIFGHR